MSDLVVGRDIPGPPQPESRFTAPTDLCPYPERWTSTDGDSTEEEVCALVYGLVRGLQPDAVLETGTGFGAMAERITDALFVNARGKLFTIENDPERVAYSRRRLGYRQQIEIIEGSSLAWTPPDDVVFDLAWFDSYYELRVPEFRAFRRWMRRGTIVCFHDTAPGHGAHRSPTADSIRTTIVAELHSQLRLVHLPTPRGATIGEVL